MIGRGEAAAHRRERLQAAAAAQRDALAAQWQGLRPALRVADRGVALARSVARHPLLVIAAAAALLVWRPRRTLQWVQYGVMAWQLLRRLGAAGSKNNQ